MLKLDKEVIQKLISDGLSKEEMIRHLSVPSTTFYRWLKDNNIIVPKSKRFQNSAEKQQVIELFKNGTTLTDIKKITGRDNRVINSYLAEVKTFRKCKTNIDSVIKMHSKGLHPSEIADIFNVDVSVIRHILKRRSLTPARNELRCEDQSSIIIDLLRIGKTQVEISKQLDIPSSSINTFIKRHGLDSVTTKNYRYQVSTGELDVFNFLKPFGAIHSYKYSGRKEIDVYLPEHKLGIEYCGLYWHTESRRGKKVHVDKLHDCQDLGIQLITIFEDEWEKKEAIVKSVIMSKLGYSNKIFARKCTIEPIGRIAANEFFDKNHLQGAPSNILLSMALIYKNTIVGCMSFGRHHRNNGLIILNRLAFKLDTSIVGGASKLLKASIPLLKQLDISKIVTYSDNLISNGGVYMAMGFKLEKELPIDYFYVKNGIRYSKQSQKKTAEERRSGLTEYQLRSSQGFERVWDCGKKVWKLDLT